MNGCEKMKNAVYQWFGSGAFFVILAIVGMVSGQGAGPTAQRPLPTALEAGPVDAWLPASVSSVQAEEATRREKGPYTSIQVNVGPTGSNIVGDAANEPSIAVDPLWSNRISIGWRQFDNVASNFRQAGTGYSTDGGRTWSAGVLDPGVFRSDPVLGFASDGTFYYDSLRYIALPETLWCEVSKSPNGGRNWGGFVDSHGGDKQWMTIDRTGGIGEGKLPSTST